MDIVIGKIYVNNKSLNEVTQYNIFSLSIFDLKML